MTKYFYIIGFNLPNGYGILVNCRMKNGNVELTLCIPRHLDYATEFDNVHEYPQSRGMQGKEVLLSLNLFKKHNKTAYT